MNEPTGKALRGERPIPKKFRGGRPKKAKPANPIHWPKPTSIRLSHEQIDFLREEAVKRGYYAYKLNKQGSVSTMIADLVDQFYVFVKGPKQTKNKLKVRP